MTDKTAGLDFDPAIEKKLLGALAIALLVVVLMAGAAAQNNLRQVESAAWVNHTHAFILETDAILSSLHAAEAAQRTFLLTGNEGSKQQTLERFAEVDEHLKIAEKLAFEKPSQIKRLGDLSVLLQQQIDLNKQAAQLRKSDPGAAAGIFTNAQARANLAKIESEIRAAKSEENRLLHEREQKLQRHTQRTEQLLYGGAGLNIVLLALAFYAVRRDLNLRREATALLEQKVKERTAELAAANSKLQIENLEQKWGQASLGRLVRHHELILNSIREAIFVISRNGHIISSNAAAAELAGAESSRLVGKSIYTLIGKDHSSDKHFLTEPIKNGQHLPPVDAFIQNANGQPVPVRVACYPTRDQENLTGAVITLTESLTNAVKEVGSADE